MTIKINKSLLKEVLKEIFDTNRYVHMTSAHPYMDKKELVYASRSGCGCESAPQKMNIHELADMYVAWANKKGFAFMHKSTSREHYVEFEHPNGTKIWRHGQSKIDIIVECCEWIYKR